MRIPRRFLLPATLAATLLASTFSTQPAGAAGRTLAQRAQALGLSCTDVTSPDDVRYTKCTGEIPTFDGIGIDTDLTFPTGASTRLPTILLLHGWGGDKNDWEAQTKAGKGPGTWHWNNVWFASRGWLAVNTTARGFKESCGADDEDPNCADGYTHLASRDFETRDSQTILGKLVDAGLARGTQLASSGGSYGGGQTWLLVTSLPWQSPHGRTLQLAAGVAKYPWTDLLSSLAYNGRASDSPTGVRDHLEPFGVPKESYIDGLYAVGRAGGHGRYDENPTHLGTNLDAQYSFVQSGEPYASKPGYQEIVDSYTDRSPYYAGSYFKGIQNGTVTPVPVLSIQGWTDPLFPPVETLQMFRRLKAFDPRYPITMAFGDVGHSNSNNPPAQWHPLNSLGNRFLDANVLGRTAEQPSRQAYAFRTRCPVATKLQRPIAGTWNSLARGVATAQAPGSAQTASSDPNPADGPATDPIANGGCLQEDAGTTDPGGAYWSFHVPGKGLTLLGLPVVRLHYELVGQDATVAFKLWDVAADGSKTLVTRGVYRISTDQGDPAAGNLTTKLFGNDYRLPGSHTLQLQITQNDHPMWRPDNQPSSLTYSHVTLTLPVRQAGTFALKPA